MSRPDSPNKTSESGPKGLETMTRALVDADNYHRWLFGEIEPFLGLKALEVGGGSGNLTRLLLPQVDTTVIEPSQAALDTLIPRIGTRANFHSVLGDICDQSIVNDFAKSGFDTVVSSNVIEHIENDLLAVRGMHKILNPNNGRALIIVPAHQWLFGTLDTAAGHYRRYSKSTLSKLFTHAGFKVEHCYHLNIVGAFAWYLNGSLIRTRDLNANAIGKQALLFDRFAVPVLKRLERIFHPPFGQSLVLVAKA